jgi:putative nucleotidyltransferase with HDIG domain
VRTILAERDGATTELKQSLDLLRKSFEGITQAMVKAIEARDPYTAGHQRNVADLAIAMARKLHVDEEHMDGLRIAGAIHDLGKMSIPAEILSKPGRLTELEFSMIKTHPQVGYDILKTIDFPWSVADAIYQHHERLDGSGYPNGLSGDDIILEARIIAVADVVEAISSHRPYRPALGTDVAIDEIVKNRNRLYDGDSVDACVELLRTGAFKL